MNRQKFLAELAKLLSFMYEEDRLYALDMYERMFDIAGDNEQWLIQNLMSPTRQAVIIARSYDAKERKLSVSAQWKEEDGYEDESDETPPFVLAINKIFDDLFPDEENAEEAIEDQVSFSDLGVAEGKNHKRPRMPKAAVLLNQTQEFKSVTDSAEQVVVPEDDSDAYWLEELYAEKEKSEEPETKPDSRINMIDRTEAFESQGDPSSPKAEPTADTEPEQKVENTAPAGEISSGPESAGINEAETRSGEELDQTPVIPVQEKKRRSIEDLLGFWKDKKPDGTAADVRQKQEGSSAPVLTEKPAVQAEKNVTNIPAATEQDASAVTTVSESSPDPIAAENSSVEVTKADFVVSERREPDSETKAAEKTEQAQCRKNEKQAEKEESFQTKSLRVEEELVIRKPPLSKSRIEERSETQELSIPRLILFLIIAIPSSVAVLVVLALLAALFLALSIGAIALGSVLVISAFSGFAVLADILLLLGAATISLAVGLLLLWIAFWLIGEAMVAWVQSARELQREWCYKEVSAT